MGRWIEPGEPAPDFQLKTDDTGSVRLSDLRGHAVVLFFYLRDGNPECVAEARSFRDLNAQIASRGARILGISPDEIHSHARFRARHGLNFPLLSDPDHRVASAYGAWRQRRMQGRRLVGLQRSTFLVDADGLVFRVWRRVCADGHAREVFEALNELAAR